ncbi:T9SS type A sorting domain-containing protein [Carboxylicivirga marina]|uniref:T9SS type A sorting domain-containing protein n=1 Tax=Carboxylicivirga marina TaxID=2800988 RepID=UPI002592590D|nr:T9SS type A sorting domain-containing protein [uncultured Carboxylicivirga sp.]
MELINRMFILFFLIVIFNNLKAQNIEVEVTTMDCNCFASADGEIRLVVTSGTPPYTYHWSTIDGANLAQGQANQYNLTAGSYSLTITDNNTQSLSETYTISEPSEIVAIETITDETCVDCNDGSISISIEGGAGGYDINWSNGDSGENITGLNSGLYTAYISDMIGCYKTLSYQVNTQVSTDVAKKENRNDFHVFPNPVTNDLFISCRHFRKNTLCEVYSLEGKRLTSKICNESLSRISMTDLECGIYFVKIIKSNQSYTYKIIKE